MNEFDVKLLCIKSVVLDNCGTDEYDMECEEGKLYRTIIGRDGIRFYIPKEKCYSFPYEIEEMAEYFIVNQPYAKKQLEKYTGKCSIQKVTKLYVSKYPLDEIQYHNIGECFIEKDGLKNMEIYMKCHKNK